MKRINVRSRASGMKISSKLVLSLAIFICISVTLSLVSLFTMQVIVFEKINSYYTITHPLDQMARFAIAYGNVRSSMRDLGRDTAEADNQRHSAAIEANLVLSVQYLRAYYETIADRAELIPMEKYERVRSLYQAMVDYAHIVRTQLIPAGMANYNQRLFEILFTDLAPIGTVIRNDIDFLATLNSERSRTIVDTANSSRASNIWVNIIILAVQLGFIIIVGKYLSVSITKPLKASSGALNQISEALDAAVGQVNDSATSIAEASNEQAASVEETSATINETSSMIANNAENTQVAAQLVTSSSETANNVGKFMSRMLETMGELKESSDTVGKIVKTIDEIAFQTNLLAINATVEAARAGGDAGRSFGVVAEEVRNLAQKSAQSAADTADIIQKNIGLTSAVREEAQSVFELAGASVEEMAKLSKLIAEINAASEEQASGAQQISAAISQIEKSTQSNAATSQQSAASAAMLRELVGDLDRIYSDVNRVVYGVNTAAKRDD